jgi:hypothetical protein
VNIEDVCESESRPSPGFELRPGDLAEVARGNVLDRLRVVDAEIARLQAERVQLLGRIGDEAMLQAELDVELDPDREIDRRRNLQWRSAALSLAAAANIGADAAQRQLAEAWTLTQKCQPALYALTCGEISLGHAQAMARELADMDPLAAGEAQNVLLPYARRMSVGLFVRKARQLLDRGDPESLAVRHEKAFADRHVALDGARDGMATLTAYLDAADAAVIRTGLGNAARRVRAEGDCRAQRQIEADLFVDLLMEGEVTIGRVGANGEGVAARTRVVDQAPVSVNLLVPAATAAGGDEAPGKIVGVGMIDPVKARELIARAPSLRRILTDPIESAIVDFDRRTYRVPAELKRMILLRDEHCRAPNCGRPVREIDHSRDYARGGATSLWNLAGLCAGHHHVKHETPWRLVQLADGVLDWVGPNGRHHRTFPDAILPAPPASPVDLDERTPFDLSEEERAEIAELVRRRAAGGF